MPLLALQIRCVLQHFFVMARAKLQDRFFKLLERPHGKGVVSRRDALRFSETSEPPVGLGGMNEAHRIRRRILVTTRVK